MDLRLKRLIDSCRQEGRPPLRRLEIAAKGRYSSEEVKFLEPYLKDSPENIQILILDILCKNGNPVSEYLPILGNELSSRIISEIMKLSELQHDPFTILGLANQDRKNVHMAILALERMGEKDLLTGLMFSGDEELSRLIGDLS